MALSNDVVTRAVFGGRFEQQDEYLGELHKAFELLGAFCLVDLFPSSRLVRWLSSDERGMRRSYGRTQRIIAKVIEGRKATRAAGVGGASGTYDEDLLDVLLRLQQEDSLEFPLTTETIGAVLFDVFAGATETIGTVLSWPCQSLCTILTLWLKHNKKYVRHLVKTKLSLLIVTFLNSTICGWSSMRSLGCIRLVL